MQIDNENKKREFKNRLYKWVLRLIKFIDKLPKDSTAQVLGKQLLRSGTSILANYVEAKSASSRKDFINFFSYSLKSGNESGLWLDLFIDAVKVDVEEAKWLKAELIQINNILASSILTLKSK